MTGVDVLLLFALVGAVLLLWLLRWTLLDLAEGSQLLAAKYRQAADMLVASAVQLFVAGDQQALVVEQRAAGHEHAADVLELRARRIRRWLRPLHTWRHPLPAPHPARQPQHRPDTDHAGGSPRR